MHICHTHPFKLLGQPFLNPDGTPAVYNPPDSQQPIRSQTQLQGSASQHQQPQVAHRQQEVFDMQDAFSLTYIHLSLHLSVSLFLSPCVCLSQVLQYSSVSYTAPQMLPVTPSQPYTTVCITVQSDSCSTYNMCVLRSVCVLLSSVCVLTSFLLTDRLKSSPRSLLM